MSTATAKICQACGDEKPLTAFRVEPTTIDGHRPVCKRCSKARESGRGKIAGRVLVGDPVPTPRFEPGTTHPVWRCETCGLWEVRNGEIEPPVCWHCTPVLRQYVNSSWARVADLVYMGAAVRYAPEPVDDGITA